MNTILQDDMFGFDNKLPLFPLVWIWPDGENITIINGATFVFNPKKMAYSHSKGIEFELALTSLLNAYCEQFFSSSGVMVYDQILGSLDGQLPERACSVVSLGGAGASEDIAQKLTALACYFVYFLREEKPLFAIESYISLLDKKDIDFLSNRLEMSRYFYNNRRIQYPFIVAIGADAKDQFIFEGKFDAMQETDEKQIDFTGLVKPDGYRGKKNVLYVISMEGDVCEYGSALDLKFEDQKFILLALQTALNGNLLKVKGKATIDPRKPGKRPKILLLEEVEIVVGSQPGLFDAEIQH